MEINNSIEDYKIYYTHANYNKPYKVICKNNYNISVYSSINNNENYDRLVLKLCVEDIFIGKSVLNDLTEFSGFHGEEYNGNSILLKINQLTYIYIGEEISMFNTNFPLVSYESPIGNNDVPYPYAVGDEYIYFLLEMTTVPREVIDLTRDAYTQYYGHPFHDQKRENTEAYQKKVIEPVIKKFRHKMHHKRRY